MASGNDFTALGRTTGSLALLWKTGPGVNDIACTEFSGTALGISSSSIAELAAVGNAHDGVVVGRTASNKWFMVRKPSNMPIINNGMADGLAGVAGSTLAGVSRFGNDGIALGLNLPSGESRVLTLGTGSSWTETTAHVTLPKLPITKMFPYGNGPLAVSYTNGADGRGGLYVGNLPPNPAFNSSSPPLVQLAFVTSTVYDGNLGGRTGADDKCQVRATDAGIGGGSWKALLSTSSENAVNLISINGQVRLRSGEIVVNNSSQLWGPTSQFAGLFYRDEFGNMVPTNSSIWTGTENTGGLKTSTNCNNWTMNSSFSGTVGNSNSDVLHFNSSTPLCNNFARLICIQQ
jgi:hypothetical protein